MMKFKIAVICLLKFSLCAAINPVDAVLVSQTGIPATTQAGDEYTAAYIFTNNLPSPVFIQVTESIVGSGFSSDGHCANVTLSAKGQPGSSCTTYIDFEPSSAGFASLNLTLTYHHNVIPVQPSLTTRVSGLCGTTVYPSNTDTPVPAPIIDSDEVWSFVSAPELHPMKVYVEPYDADQLAPGLIFNGPFTSSGLATYGQTGALIVDNDDNPIWFRPLSSPSLMNTDVKTQVLNNQPVLTFWQGTLATPPAYTNIPAGGAETGSCFYILDNSYRILNTVTAFFDFIPDVHEYLITSNNTLIFYATKVVSMDLTPYGGPQNGAIHDYSIQEIDLATNKLLFFWDALDHISLRSSKLPAASAVQSSGVWDPYHLNSIGLISDSPDDLLISSRNTWTIYRLNKTTGSFIWKLVGDGSGDITIPDHEARFSWQHDARLLPGNVLSMFDDNCCANPDVIPPGTKYSHGLVLTLDFDSTPPIATLDTTYYHYPNVNSSSQGNNQLLSNTNRFIGFGSSGSYTEYAAAGNTEETSAVNILYNAQMPGGNMSYRSYRKTWVGMPYYPPRIAVQTNSNQTTVYASWNGATEVSTWQVYAGFYTDSLSLVASAEKTGFETAINVSGGLVFYQVKALNRYGQVIGTSKIVKST